jgi:cell shape-determining protein MreC
LVGTLCVAVFFFLISFFGNPADGALSSSFEKIYVLQNDLFSGASLFISSIAADERVLVEENEKLRVELEKFKTLDERTQAIGAENDALREFMGLRERKSMDVARVIAKPPAIPSGMIIIDSPQSGLNKRARVFDADGQILGIVGAVHGKDYGKVVLFSAPGKKTQVVTQNGEMVDAIGQGGVGLYFEVPKGFEIKRGDLIYVNDGSLLAEVASVESQKNDPFLDVYLRLLSNISVLTHVAVEK